MKLQLSRGWVGVNRMLGYLGIGVAVGLVSAYLVSLAPLTVLAYGFFLLLLLLAGYHIGALPAIILVGLWVPRTLDEFIGIPLYRVSFTLVDGTVTELIKGFYLIDLLFLLATLAVLMRRRFRVSGWFYTVLAFYLVAIVHSIGQTTMYGGIMEYIRLPLVILVVQDWVTDVDRWKKLLYTMVVALFALEVMAILRFAMNPTGIDRAFSVGLGVNAFATAVAVSLPLIQAVTIIDDERPAWVWWICMGVAVISGLLTGSRQVFVGMMVWLWFAFKDAPIHQKLIWCLGLPVLVFVALNSTAGTRLLQYGIDSIRLALTYGAFRLWVASPLLGHGLNSFQSKWPSVSILPSVYDFYWHCHNLYLQIAAEDLDKWGTQSSSVTPMVWPTAALVPRYTSLAQVSSEDRNAAEVVNKVTSALQKLNVHLRLAQLQVGYRVRDEVALFVLNAIDVVSFFKTSDDEPVDPLDLALSMKVLPRIVGGSGGIRSTLVALIGWASSRRENFTDNDADETTAHWQSEGRPSALRDATFPRCAARACLMWERINDEGFTSYWL